LEVTDNKKAPPVKGNSHSVEGSKKRKMDGIDEHLKKDVAKPSTKRPKRGWFCSNNKKTLMY